VRALLRLAAAGAGSRLRPVRNRGFRTRLRQDRGGPVALLSPHLDDAVLDCWSILAGPGQVQVVNVLAGEPRAGTVGYYEQLAGASDSATHVRRRVAEDREALQRAGRTPINLGFLSLAHRRGRPEPSFRQLDAALAARVARPSCVYAPAALGAPHPDHALVRAYALALARQGMPARLYADLPYCAVYGWPGWVTGEPGDPRLDVDAYWRASLDGAARLCARERAEVVRLPAEQAAAKLAAMRTYRAEFSVLDRGPVRQLSNPAIHAFEVFWPVDTGAR
jgi:LmbE family N-acetylglucosaminyl deacetylase